MPQLITVTEANDHLRLDLGVVEVATSPPSTTFEDDRIPGLLVKIAAAEAIVLDYLKLEAVPAEGSPAIWSDNDREVVRAAVLLVLSALWDDAPERTLADYMRGPDLIRQGGTIPLLLARLRDPTLA